MSELLLPDLRCCLCESGAVSRLHHDQRREYWQCEVCQLIFVPPAHFLTAEDELRVYQQHRNLVDSTDYRRFLNRMYEPMAKCLEASDEGLDFGCGPGPALAAMFREAGYRMEVFDPFFANDAAVFGRTYDFITSTEVFEHLHHPRREILRLWACLKSGGILGIMTKRLSAAIPFAGWFYHRDPTHVIFWNDQTFQWLAAFLSAELTIISDDVVLLRKPQRE